jgi:hypothetical protein
MPIALEKNYQSDYIQTVQQNGLVEMRNVPTVPLPTLFSEGKQSGFPFLDLARHSLDNHLTPINGDVSPHQIRSALDVVGEPDNLGQIIQALLDVPQELENMNVLKHRLGFTRFTLLTGKNFKLKVHTYGWTKPPEEAVAEDIHDHRFQRAGGRTLFGSLQKELFVPSTANDGNGIDYYMYHQTSDSNRLNPIKEARVKHINPSKPSISLPKNAIYTLSGKTFHRISFNPEEPTATLFLHTVSSKNETNKAIIFSTDPDVKVDEDYPLVPSSEGAAILENFLAVLH